MSKSLHSEKTVLLMAIEVSAKTWRIRWSDGSKQRERCVGAWNQGGVLREIERTREKLGLPADAQIVSCYEAGRDGFSIHRFLESHGIESMVIDAASIAMPRRRRAKTDRLDVKQLLNKLTQYYLGGDTDIWRVVNPPDPGQEDERRLNRERDHLVKARTRETNRIRSLLALQGKRVGAVRSIDVNKLKDWSGRVFGESAKAEIQRHLNRLKLIDEQIKELGDLRKERLREPQTKGDEVAAQLMRLKGIGDHGSWVLSKEIFGWRDLKNRRQVGAVFGLTGMPYNSGESSREGGISKAGCKRARWVAIQLAWGWLRYQPDSELTHWFNERFAHGSRRLRRIGIVALARKLMVALWKYLQTGEPPAGAVIVSA